MDSSSPARADRPLLGVALVALATLVFAMADTITKHLAMLYPVTVVITVRYLVNVSLLLLVFWPRHRSRLWQGRRFWLQVARGLCLALASLTVALALRVMPLGETVAIVYLAPFLVLLLAMPLLGERVGIVGWIGAALGFIGVLLIVRPGSNLDPAGVLFAVMNAVFSTGYHLLTRKLGRTESTASMLFHTAWVGAVLFCVLAIPELQVLAIVPATDLGLMVALGALMTVAHFLFTAAYREASAAVVAPANYLHLVWAGALGYAVFGHIPEIPSVVGMATVVAAGAVVAVSSHRSNRRAPVADAPTDP